MSTTAVKIPEALSALEIKNGVATFLRQEGVPENVASVIRAGLDKTCLLNGQSYWSFSGTWKIWKGNWSLDYEVDDRGLKTKAFLGGQQPNVELEMEGRIEAMPPDAFRRRSEQPIPKPREVAPKKDDAVGISMARRTGGRRRMQ